MKTIPYFSQWESSDMIEQFLDNREAALHDPLWARSGAATPEDYQHWSQHLCGLACLKMILAAEKYTEYPLFTLKDQALAAGAYIETLPDTAAYQPAATRTDIKGLIYAPFITMIKAQYDLQGCIHVDITAQQLPAILKTARYFIASVHPDIRTPNDIPPYRGGHLVLVTGIDSSGLISFHNPSGCCPATQRDVAISLEVFDRYFAGRGMAVGL